MISTHFLEIRYEPLAIFLNIRGGIADFVKDQRQFPHWEIGSNRVDFWKQGDRAHKGFVSFRNCGYEIQDPPTEHFFRDHAAKFISTLEKFPGLPFYPPIKRIGVRARFYHPVENINFEELRERFFNKFFTPGLSNIFDARVDDVGAHLNFRDGDIFLNTISGPMKREQFLKQYSPGRAEGSVPPLGLFLDVDCFRHELGKLKTKTLIAEIKSLDNRCWHSRQALREFLELP